MRFNRKVYVTSKPTIRIDRPISKWSRPTVRYSRRVVIASQPKSRYHRQVFILPPLISRRVQQASKAAELVNRRNLLEAIAEQMEKYQAAMGRSKSTPGLVETKGRVPLEEMWISPMDPIMRGTSSLGPPYSNNSIFSPTMSPVSRITSRSLVRTTESALSVMSSGQSSDDHNRQTVALAKPPPPKIIPEPTPTVSTDVRQEEFIAEITRLRERLHTLEAENATLNMKLSQQQWEVENRLAEIEMQICGASSADSSAEDNERNKESII